MIWLDADQELEEDCETFGIWPEMNDRQENWFTKTEHCPYDMVVSAVLLRLKALAPEAARIGSDFWDDDGDAWSDGTASLVDLGLPAAAVRPDARPSRGDHERTPMTAPAGARSQRCCLRESGEHVVARHEVAAPNEA